MKSQLVTIDPKTTATKIIESLSGGLRNAAEVYRQYVADGGDPMELRKHVPVSASMWRTLDDVATGRIDVRVLCLSAHASSAVRLLPPTTQKQVLDTGVEVITDDGSTIRVPIQEMTPDQARQAIGSGEIRTASQQAAYLKTLKPKDPPKAKPVCQFEIKGKKLRVLSPVVLDMSDLLRIIGQMS